MYATCQCTRADFECGPCFTSKLGQDCVPLSKCVESFALSISTFDFFSFSLLFFACFRWKMSQADDGRAGTQPARRTLFPNAAPQQCQQTCYYYDDASDIKYVRVAGDHCYQGEQWEQLRGVRRQRLESAAESG